MLINRSPDDSRNYELTLGSVHNYYEHMVFESLKRNKMTAAFSLDLQADVLCLALNRLPARYVRHDVDTAFFLTTKERLKIQDMVDKAVDEAIAQVVRQTESPQPEPIRKTKHKRKTKPQ